MSAREERRTKSKISHKASVLMRAGNACQPGPTSTSSVPRVARSAPRPSCLQAAHPRRVGVRVLGGVLLTVASKVALLAAVRFRGNYESGLASRSRTFSSGVLRCRTGRRRDCVCDRAPACRRRAPRHPRAERRSHRSRARAPPRPARSTARPAWRLPAVARSHPCQLPSTARKPYRRTRSDELGRSRWQGSRDPSNPAPRRRHRPHCCCRPRPTRSQGSSPRRRKAHATPACCTRTATRRAAARATEPAAPTLRRAAHDTCEASASFPICPSIRFSPRRAARTRDVASGPSYHGSVADCIVPPPHKTRGDRLANTNPVPTRARLRGKMQLRVAGVADLARACSPTLRASSGRSRSTNLKMCNRPELLRIPPTVN